MSQTMSAEAKPRLQPVFLAALAWAAVIGVGALLAGAMVGPLFVPAHDPMADTISDLAAGRGEIIMDVALYGFAAGLIALGLACAHAHQGGAAWTTGIVSLVLLAGVVTMIGARNEYGDGDQDGIVIHTELVYALGTLFLIMPLCLAERIDRLLPWTKRALRGAAIVWAVMAPVFFFLPNAIDGAYERILGLVASAQIIICAWALFAFARSEAKEGFAEDWATDSGPR